MGFKRAFLFTLCAVTCISCAFLAGFFVNASLDATRTSFPVLDEAYTILAEHALNPLPPAPALEYGMIRGMLQAYGDPYTVFIEPVQHELETNSLQGSFGGIGVQLGRDNQGNYLLYPFPTGPAAQAGVQENDRLLAVDDLAITPDTTSDQVESAIRGPVGQRVRLTIARAPDFISFDVTIQRKDTPLPSASWHLDADEPRLGIVKVNLFAASTPGEIQKAIADLKTRGATGFALDLRDNGGGLLSTGVDTARLFLQSGPIIREKYHLQPVDTYFVEHPGPFADLPLVVLVNHGTASAAEIVAGALQMHGRAQLIGAPTYGKSTIQFIFDLSDGSSLHVTAGQWWIPSADVLDTSNPEAPSRDTSSLQPDIPIPADAPGSDPDLSAAIQVLFHP
jgi:carboxyl-terminal processing protease